MKVLYLSLWDFKNGIADGVVKKIIWQIKTLKDYGIDADYTYYDSKSKSFMINQQGTNKVIGKIKRFPGIEMERLMFHYAEVNRYDSVYIRFSGRVDLSMLHYMHEFKKRGCRIYLEIPTYPYAQEAKTISGKIDNLVDALWRNRIKRYVNNIVLSSQNISELFGIPTIYIPNGVRMDEIEIAKCEDNVETSTINLLAIANFQKTHGYEKCIIGLEKYIKQNNIDKKIIKIHFVGYGIELNKYKSLVSEKGLEEYVIFYGMKSGNELEQIYRKIDIGLGCFNVREKGVSSLKTKELLARGIPIITSDKEDIFANNNLNRTYILGMPDTICYMDMNQVVDFYNNIYENGMKRTEIRKAVRNSVHSIVDMKETMKPIVMSMMQRNI